MAGNQCGQLDRSKVDRLRLVFQMVGGHLDCDIGLQCVVCPIEKWPADYHSLSRSIIGQLSVRLWVDYRSMICRLSTDHWSIVRPQWIRIRTHDPKSLDC